MDPNNCSWIRIGELSSLDTVHRGGALVSDYGFDSNGNRTSHRIGAASPLRGRVWPCLGDLAGTAEVTVAGSFDAQDRMLSYGTCQYEYTRNGELTRRTDSASGAVTNYQYDEFGNLRRVDLADARVVTYHIDGLNRRVGKSIDGVRQWGLLYANQLEPVAELDGAGNIVASFLYADRPHVPSLMLKGGHTYRILSDHLGSVRLVIDLADGSIAQRLAYDEYGNVVEDTQPGFQPFAYAGGLYDPDTGFTRFGARDYDPVAGRWTAKDPTRFRGLDTNLYAYVRSNPVNWLDPLGLWNYASEYSTTGDALTENMTAVEDIVDQAYRDASGDEEAEATVTYTTNGRHGANSLHDDGDAIDLRVRDLTDEERQEFVDNLIENLGDDYDVIDEGDHVHCEYDPD
ncbi:MAG: RHS repeat-associated core domain-containing protein [Xanthomonadales bacterium]|nr:RHS repeat-associated core domain-containing protein [Xanthomonadales bacterium]